MLTVKGLNKSFGTRPVLVGVDFTVQDGQKSALIGPNGVGKSTLLRLIAGLDTPDSGEVIVVNDRSVAYLPQEIEVDEFDRPVLEYLKRQAGIWEPEERLRALEKDLSSQTALAEYAEVQERYSDLGGYEFEASAAKVLSGLGLQVGSETPVGQLSGGERSKLMLASVLLANSPCVLLDEPTNNLDLQAIEWLEGFIASSQQSFLIVSHDRALLERVVEKVIEIDWYERVAREFTGSYGDYLEYRQRLVRRREQQYEGQQQERERLERSAKQSRAWAEQGRHQTGSDNDKYGRGSRRDRSSRLAGRASAAEQQIEHMPEIERIRQREPLIIPLEVDNQGGMLITAEAVVAGYEKGFSTDPFSLALPAGGRVGILGLNGVGKSTVLRTLIGAQPALAGKVTINQRAVTGVLAQAHENMPRKRTALAHFSQEVGGDRSAAYAMLARFHLLPEDVSKQVGELSPGERARLQLATFAARGVNLLVLDEPTNHLDIDALEALVAVLKTYQGAVLFVSHDRYFLEQMKGAELYTLENRRLHR